MIDKQELRRLAEKCEAMFPSPWKSVGKESWRLIGFPQVEYSDEKGSYIPVHNDTDAAYIAAASPAAILQLLDELERAERVCRAAEKMNSDCGLTYKGKGRCERCGWVHLGCEKQQICAALKKWQEGR